MKKRKLIKYQDYLLNSLRDPNEAQAYLNAALLEEDPRMFLLALKNVIDAQKNSIVAVAQATELKRESLRRMLSKKGNPRLTSVKSVLNAIDFDLAVLPAQRR